MKTLKQIYDNHHGNLLNKWNHYIDIYDRYFSAYRNKKIVFLEIGVAHGGSLQMWREYFGKDAQLIGVDINPECRKFETVNTQIYIGSQSDTKFLTELKSKIGEVDILLDDGGHTMDQQNITFNILFDVVKKGGLYVCEDLHTSYWKEYGGGLKKKGTFIENSKNLIDYLHGWYAKKKDETAMLNKYTKSIKALHFFDSMLFVEKDDVEKPFNTFKGKKENTSHESFEQYELNIPLTYKIKTWLKRRR